MQAHTDERGTRRRAKQARRRAAISLTPLVDVVFILVIFFMLASTFTRTNSLELHVPGSGATAQPTDIRVERLTILADMRYALNGDVLDATALTERLSDLTDHRFLVQSADDARFQDIVTFLDLSARRGLRNLAFVDRPADR